MEMMEIVIDLAVLHAFARCKLIAIRLELTVALNFMHAPFRTSANRGRVSEVAREYFANRTHACELYRHLYEDISLAMNGGRPHPRLGEESHIRETFEQLRTLECYSKNFALAKLGRFHDFVSKVGRVQKYSSALLLMLLYIGLHVGWFKNIEETPLASMYLKPFLDDAKLPDLVPPEALAPLPSHLRSLPLALPPCPHPSRHLAPTPSPLAPTLPSPCPPPFRTSPYPHPPTLPPPPPKTPTHPAPTPTVPCKGTRTILRPTLPLRDPAPCPEGAKGRAAMGWE